MKKNRWIITGTASLLLVAVGAYFWTMGLITSLENYRSLLHDTPPAPAAPLGWEENSPTRRVVFILVDGLRDDISRNAEVMPALNQLRAQGASATSHSQTPSYSAPGYSVINIGAWPYLSDGPAMNLDYELTPTWTQDNLFSAAHRAGLKTAISGYYWFEKLIPQEDVDASFYTPEEDDAADRAVVDAALPWLKSGDYQFLFIHLDQVDYAGHYEGGPQDPRWDAAAGRVDAYINEIVTELDLELDTVIITSDHGHIDRGGHGGHEEIVLTEPLILAGAGIAPGEYPDTQMIDFAPTIAALLGTNIP
ncbi:MAG: sulfatase-like hydrolase/transferase, partial [Anaerolineae bacterium]|nr:sulfatase-like hydrolase/transferase [Anaerolineae bacterium]